MGVIFADQIDYFEGKLGLRSVPIASLRGYGYSDIPMRQHNSQTARRTPLVLRKNAKRGTIVTA